MTLDLVGAFDKEGNPIPDGRPDNPGNVLFYRPVLTGQKTNFSINGGITATISIPLDRAHIKSCHRAAEKQVALLEQQLADKRLNHEIARLKNCGDLLRKGISFHPKSPYRGICADVVPKIHRAICRLIHTQFLLPQRPLKLLAVKNRLNRSFLPQLFLDLFNCLFDDGFDRFEQDVS